MEPSKNPPLTLITFLLMIAMIISSSSTIDVDVSRKLDETGSDQGQKCSPCGQNPPPASPPPPPPPSCPPPPPPPEPVLPPPPPPKKPPSPSGQYCPPPPASIIYITGPPGSSLYPVDQDYNGGRRNFQVGILSLVAGTGLFGLLVFGR